jgi:hypothetical protein
MHCRLPDLILGDPRAWVCNAKVNSQNGFGKVDVIKTIDLVAVLMFVS